MQLPSMMPNIQVDMWMEAEKIDGKMHKFKHSQIESYGEVADPRILPTVATEIVFCSGYSIRVKMSIQELEAYFQHGFQQMEQAKHQKIKEMILAQKNGLAVANQPLSNADIAELKRQGRL
jgi:hypothetical protein